MPVAGPYLLAEFRGKPSDPVYIGTSWRLWIENEAPPCGRGWLFQRGDAFLCPQAQVRPVLATGWGATPAGAGKKETAGSVETALSAVYGRGERI